MNTCPKSQLKTPPRWPYGLLGWWKNYLAVLLLGFLFLAPQHALAATGINKQINFQGKVVNANGTNVTNGNYDFVFSIYTVASGGTAVWTESRTGASQVTVTDGIFRVSLGSITALPGSIDFNTDNIYLGINFNSDGEMTPRVQFTAVPYAFNALKVAGLTVTDTTGTLTIPNSKTISFADSFTTSGANALTLTTTGATNVTLPTSGTLLNQAYQTIQDEATGLTQRSTVNFTGAGVSCVDNAGLTRTDCTITSGGGSLTIRESDTSPSVASVTTLEFGPAANSSDEFVVTDQTGGVARVVLGTKVVKTDGDFNFLDANPGTAYAIAGSDSTTAGAAGGNLTVRSGAGLTTGGGGNLILAGGTSPSGTAGYLALQTAGTERLRLQADGTFLFEKGANDVVLSITAPATATRTYTVPDFGADDSFVGLAANQALTNKTYNGLTISTTTGTLTLANGSSLITSGANSLTFTTTGTTSLTLPTSGTVTALGNTTTGSGSIVLGTGPTINTITFGDGTITDSGGLTITSGGAGNLALNSAGGTVSSNATTVTFGSATALNLAANSAINPNASGTISFGTGANTTGLTLGKAATTTTFNSTSWTATPTISGLITASLGVSVAAGQSYSGAGAVTLSSGGTSGLTIDSASGAVTVAASDALVITGGAGNPTATNGTVWYDTTANKIKIVEGAVVKTVCNTTDLGCGAGGGGGVNLSPATADTFGADNDPGIWLNENGVSTTAPLLRLDNGGVARFTVANGGGLTINGTDSSVVRTLTSEFATGTVGSNLTNANDQIEMSDGTVPNSGNGTITTASQPVTSAAIGAGAHSITRADGKYLIIRGGGTGLDVYDSVAGTFTNSAQVLNGAAGAGAISLPRPDGRYRVIHGGGLLTTSLVDPQGTAAVGASVAVVTKSAGTVAFRRPDGRFLLTNAPSVATTEIYNPVADTFAAGPSATAGTWGAGALVLPRPDGGALIVQGGAAATTQLYNPNSGTGSIGVFTAGPALPTGCEINGAGAIAIRKPNGTYLVASKINASAIYDPVANTWSQNNGSCTTPAAGKGPTVALADGAHAIPMQDGKFLILIGGTSTVANIYDPSTDTFTAHGTAVTAGGAGRHSIMRHDGTWQLINGGGTGTNNFDTGLPMTGTTTKYTSDDISTTQLNTSSTLRWTAALEAAYAGRSAATNTAFSPIQFFVRTAVNSGGCTTPLNSATDRELLNSGDLIRPGSTDNCIRITVQFNRPIPKQILNDMGIWVGNGKTSMRRDYTTPTLFDLVVDNSTVLRRNNFEFTKPNAGSAAPQNETSGPIFTRAEAQSDRLYLPWGRITPLTQVGTTGFYMGVVGNNHPNLTQAQTNDGTIVIARPNKTFKIIASLTTPAANATIYDPATTTFSAAQSGSNIPTAANGVGGFAVKRPDGKFLVVLGNATTTTNIYDPDLDTFAAGPALIAAAGVGASAIPNVDGTFTIVHGAAATTSSLYDPVRNTMIAGPTLTTASNCGFWAVPLINSNGRVGSQYKVFPGVAIGAIGVTTAMNYDAIAKVFTAGTALTSTHGCGSFAFQRQDGYWLTVSGAAGTAGAIATTTNLLNPYNGTTLAGPALSVGAGRGAHVIPRGDGTFLIIHAGATPATTTTVYFPWGGTFGVGAGIGTMAAGPALATTTGTGALSFQRPDGKWVIINGNASAATNTYDAGWYADGEYRSEQVQVPALVANSTIEWKQTPDNFVRMEVRAASTQTALGTTAYQTVGRPGESIKNAGNETWVQVQVNFRRDFPTFGGSLNGVYRTGGGMAYLYREISIPTLFEYKINNGMNLLDLQANGLSLLRVTSNGGVYSAQQGGFFAGGADLAENYSSTDALEKGEVVVLAGPQNVKRSQGQYQNDVLGVVSTAPGFVAGSYTENSYPIALVGRVPVKVSTENGEIKAGDFLTSASIPGYAMKATKAGRVLGKALEDLAQTDECPAFGMGNFASTKCGTIMMFVNLIDYLGAPVEIVMAEQHQVSSAQNTQTDSNTGGLESASISQGDALQSLNGAVRTPSILDDLPEKQKQILAFLKDLKDNQDQGVTSEVFTDRVSATSEIISPKVITDILYAKKVKADSIEGLEILTDKVSALSNQVAGIATNSAGLTPVIPSANEGSLSNASSNELSDSSPSAQNDKIAIGNITIETAQIKLDLIVLGKLETQGGLVVGGPVEFKNDTVFNSLAQFISKVIFKDTIFFEGRPTFNKDTAGFAVIKKDADSVDVAFDNEYIDTPIVSVNLTFDPVKLADGSNEDPKILQKRIVEGGYIYFVTNRSTKGFSIVLNKNTSEDLTFSWIALAVKAPKTSLSKLVLSPTATDPAALIPSSTPTVSPFITPTTEAAPTISSQTLTVKNTELGFLRVRSDPSATSPEIGQVSPGQVFKIIEASQDWYKIEYTDGKQGWVNANYVSLNAD